MTKKNELKTNLIQLGKILKEYRMQLSLKTNSRQFFIDDRVEKNLLDEGWISEKTLTNIENGHNLPSLITLKHLAFALEVDFLELIGAIEKYILEPTK